MSSLPYIKSDDILSLITMTAVNEVIEDAFRAYAENKVIMPPKVYLELPQFNGDFRAMPGYLESMNLAGIKWVNVHPNNQTCPTVMATLILNSPETGEPLAIMDGTIITALRTGAAGGIATKHLATPNASTLALIGCGAQAWYQYLSIREVRSITTVFLCDPSDTNRHKLHQQITQKDPHVTCHHQDSQTSCQNSDIIVTTTPSRKPVIQSEWIQPGTHINAMGADAQGKQELAISLLQQNQLFIDDWEQASHSGEINVGISTGLLKKGHIAGTIGEVVGNYCPGRTANNDITIFDSTGLAVQDIALGGLVYNMWKKRQSS